MSPAVARSLSVTLAGVLLAAFGTPLRALWAAPESPVWLGYLVWALPIAGLCLLGVHARGARDDDEKPPQA